MSHKLLNAIFGLKGPGRMGKNRPHVDIEIFMFFLGHPNVEMWTIDVLDSVKMVVWRSACRYRFIEWRGYSSTQRKLGAALQCKQVYIFYVIISL